MKNKYGEFGYQETVWLFSSQAYMPITHVAEEEYQRLFLETVAEKDGYVQFFVANETTMPVYFDDISGIVRRSRVIQQAHYYPFGLPMAKITTLGNPEYAYFFTGKELYEDEGLMYYDYGARMYDVQIGRWTTTDPEWQLASPYDYCGGDPINYIDPDGRFVFLIPIALAVVGAYVGGSIANETANPFKWDYSSGKTWVGMGIGAAVGFGVGCGISAGLAASGITTNTGFLTSLGVYSPTCPGFALNGYTASQLAPVAYKAAAITLGTAGVAGGGSAAYYNIPGVAEGLGSGLNAIGQAANWVGGQVALASIGGGNALADALKGFGNMGLGDLGLTDLKRPDFDGYLTFNEAVYWWQQGKGVSLNVDYSKYDYMWKSKRLKRFLKNWSKEPFKGITNLRTFNFFDNLFEDWNSDGAKIFGNLTFRRTGPHRFSLPTFDDFNWEDHPGISKRDFLTWVGRNFVIGSGETFRINFWGKWFLKF